MSSARGHRRDARRAALCFPHSQCCAALQLCVQQCACSSVSAPRARSKERHGFLCVLLLHFIVVHVKLWVRKQKHLKYFATNVEERPPALPCLRISAAQVMPPHLPAPHCSHSRAAVADVSTSEGFVFSIGLVTAFTFFHPPSAVGAAGPAKQRFVSAGSFAGLWQTLIPCCSKQMFSYPCGVALANTCAMGRGCCPWGICCCSSAPHLLLWSPFGTALMPIRKGLMTAWALNSELWFTSTPNRRGKKGKRKSSRKRRNAKADFRENGVGNLPGGEVQKRSQRPQSKTEGGETTRRLQAPRGCSFPIFECSWRLR